MTDFDARELTALLQRRHSCSKLTVHSFEVFFDKAVVLYVVETTSQGGVLQTTQARIAIVDDAGRIGNDIIV